MLRTLYSRLAAVLMGVFVAVGGLMIVATQTMFEPDRLLALATDLVIGAVAFSLLAALVVFRFLTRRLRSLADAMDRFRTAGFAQPVRIDERDAEGDEIDRLAHTFTEMSERIVEQLELLAQVDARRRELLANVSHDLRTPLASMQGYLETLLLQEDKLTPDERRSYLLIATRHCERLGTLVRDLFDLTRLEADEIRPRPEPFSIAELAQDVAQKFALRATNARQRLVTDIDPATPAIVADIGMIERVLENLIENAMRYTPADGTISLGVAPDGGAVAVTVGDTGRGIAADELGSIFDRYYRIDRGERGDTANAGLGLAITRRIVELHGGTIRAESEPSSGTRFVVMLPHGAPPP
ncbi:MAG TPA: HAMP domain-containing sensor histidine kinase [Rhodocyclaceae bacterium]|nr:HAMP domain-containing sensor histidine kinase [Rhodocyclaceae bacterium]